MTVTSRIDTEITRWQRVNWLTSGSAQFEDYSPQQFYTMLDMYYQNNGLYYWLMYNLYNQGVIYEGMMPLRNPAFRVVEFYVAKLWAGNLPDALPIVAKNKAIIEPLQQVWKWSNWAANKQQAARHLACYGDWFCKVATRKSGIAAEGAKYDRVYFQNIYPGNVTDFDADERGVLQWVRIDTVAPMRQANGEIETVNRTEVWDAAAQQMRIWEHDKGADTDLDRLGQPVTDKAFTDYGIDFIPIVHAKFRDIGEKRGMGSFSHALDKIDEANREATRLAQMLFRHNKNTWVIENPGMDATGRPLPPPKVGSQNTDPNKRTKTDDNTVTVGDEEIFTLPGTATMKSLVPNLQYGDALKILQDQVAELEHDLPELAYYRLRDMTQISGIAAQHLLGDAIDRVLEARANAEAALARLDAIALTIGAAGKLPEFKGIKDKAYDKGLLDHTFEERAVIALSEKDRAEIIKGYTDAGIPLVTAAQRAGFSDQDIADMLKEKEEQAKRGQATIAATWLAAERNSRNPDNQTEDDNYQQGGGNNNQPPQQDKGSDQ